MNDLLIKQLIQSEPAAITTSIEWELLFRQARAAGLMERLAVYLRKHESDVPEYAQAHLSSAEVFYANQQRIVRWELSLLVDIFKQLQTPLILLKGAAYVAAGLDAGQGRVFNDIDILVPRDGLDKVQQTLAWHGWFPEKMDAYDERYYLRWMHELPPLQHVERHTTLDVHHNILPITGRYCPDAKHLLQRATRVKDGPYWVLSPEDMVLHSASHLFLGGEFENGLRDLTDLDLLLRQFASNDKDFYSKLIERAIQLRLSMPLFFALRYTHRFLRTPVPTEILLKFTDTYQAKTWMFDFLFEHALLPDHPSCDDRWTGLARFMLYIRSHWLKMPLYLLIPHLLRKGWMRLSGKAGH